MYVCMFSEVVEESAGLAGAAEIKALEDFVPVRLYQVTLLNGTITCSAATHPNCDVTLINTRRSNRTLKKVAFTTPASYIKTQLKTWLF